MKSPSHISASSGFFACTLLTIILITASSMAAQEKVLHYFGAKPALNPAAPLISDAAGNLYGTTGIGGNVGSCPQAPHICGTVFKLERTSSGFRYRLPYIFKGGSDGDDPQGGLVFDTAGNLYGSTLNGGSKTCFGQPYGCGTIFELAPTSHGWSETVIHRFASDGSDGALPTGSLTVDASGNLYGTTFGGGGSSCFGFGCGTVFELSPGSNGWTETVLYSFAGGSDGDAPQGNLIFDTKGNLYGVAGRGGVTNGICPDGCGVVFELTPQAGGGWTQTVVYSFTGGSDGAFPSSGVILDAQDNLYGTAAGGGATACTNGCGTVFELSPSGSGWNFSTLYGFSGSDGDLPVGIVLAPSGDLFGATEFAGSGGWGNVFKLVPGSGTWTETVLHQFTGGKDGGQPPAGVILDTAGNLYGTTFDGGASDWGVVFEITP